MIRGISTCSTEVSVELASTRKELSPRQDLVLIRDAAECRSRVASHPTSPGRTFDPIARSASSCHSFPTPKNSNLDDHRLHVRSQTRIQARHLCTRANGSGLNDNQHRIFRESFPPWGPYEASTREQLKDHLPGWSSQGQQTAPPQTNKIRSKPSIATSFLNVSYAPDSSAPLPEAKEYGTRSYYDSNHKIATEGNHE